MIAATPALVDTNILVYRHDPGDPARRRRATEILRRGAAEGSLVLPQQALVEFVAVTTRPRGVRPPLLGFAEAARAVEGYLLHFEVLWPTPEVLRTALGGRLLHGLPWYDAHLWACAEVNGIPTLLSEDFQHGRVYGTVRVLDPFRET